MKGRERIAYLYSPDNASTSSRGKPVAWEIWADFKPIRNRLRAVSVLPS